MASLPRPYRLPKRKSVFRAYVPLPGQFERHAAFHDRHRQQSSPASLVAFVEWSWSALQQSRVGLGILIYCPMIRQGLVHIEEIGPPALESSYHIGSRDIVPPPASLGSRSYSTPAGAKRVECRLFRSNNPGPSSFRDASSSASRSTYSQRRTRPSLRPSG
jgi:hypothetical protein